jgi:hypothetical protein
MFLNVNRHALNVKDSYFYSVVCVSISSSKSVGKLNKDFTDFWHKKRVYTFGIKREYTDNQIYLTIRIQEDNKLRMIGDLTS